MSATKHTAGPWKVVPFVNHFDIQFEDDGECIAEHVYTEADARLIAAAPDLLEALRECVGQLGSFPKSVIAKDNAYAIIAKATGETT